MEQTPSEQDDGGQQERPEDDQERPAPQVYVASLSDYNDGRLHGAWVNAAKQPEELHEEVTKMLARSPIPGAEEFAIHDYEGFGPLRLSEYESLETVALIGRGIAEHGPAFAHWAELVGTNEPDVLDKFEDHYEGHAESVEAYAEQLLDDMGFGSDFDLAGQLPASLQPYVRFDVKGFARDLELSGDIMTSEGDGGIYVFRPL
jgi:antirestriction protein